MAKINYTLLFLLIFSTNSFSQSFQYHIYERYYNHYDSMRSSAYGELHTYLQGEMLEDAITRNLKVDAKKCVAGTNSNYIFSLEPDLFYNYQMNILYGELKVKIYGNGNVLKNTVTVNTKHVGKINQKANFYINKIYDELITKLGEDVLSKLPKENLINGNFCTIIELSKPKSNIDKDYKKPIQA